LIIINNEISIFDEKIKFKATRSTGPGGQHVNKVSTAVILKYELKNHNYPDWFLEAIKFNISRNQLLNNEIITIKSNRYRSQLRNKEDAIKKLVEIFRKSCIKKKSRHKTHPPTRSKEKRLLKKRIQSKKKDLRKTPNIDD